MKNGLVSVIVPVYNVEQFLDRCVFSILSQSYVNLEVILVDDGSMDLCSKKCDDFAIQDKRVKVIHKENEGQSMARKAGMLIADGEFIVFVDGDDWLENNMIEHLVAAQRETGADIVMCGSRKIYANHVIETHLFSQSKTFTGEESKTIHRRMVGMVENELVHPDKLDNLVTMWGKLYTRENALLGIWVSERKTGTSEDTIFNLGAFEKCETISYLDECLYNYRKTNDSSTTTKYIPDLTQKWNTLYNIIETYIEEKNCSVEYRTALNNRIAINTLGLVLNETNNPNGVWFAIKNVKKILREPKRGSAVRQIPINNMPFYWKIFYFIAKIKCSLLLIFMGKVIQIMRTKKIDIGGKYAN